MSVYPVREDTLLAKRNLKKKDLEQSDFLEIGVGNAELSITAAEKDAKVTAVDKSKEAVYHAKERFEKSGLEAEIFESDLFEKVNRKFDLILFNPPYLPGPEGIGDEEMWRGGEKGLEISRRFLEKVPNYLKQEGEALLVLSSHTNLQEIVNKHDLKQIDKENIWFETIYLYKFE